jgi:hypothetical protein
MDATAFAISNKEYVGTGMESSFSGLKNDFWEYDPGTDTWRGQQTSRERRGAALLALVSAAKDILVPNYKHGS